jgi:hypothetical protein
MVGKVGDSALRTNGGPEPCSQILVIEVAFEESFFPWDHNQRHEGESRHERYQQPEIIQPNGQSEYEKDESQIDGIATHTGVTCGWGIDTEAVKRLDSRNTL